MPAVEVLDERGLVLADRVAHAALDAVAARLGRVRDRQVRLRGVLPAERLRGEGEVSSLNWGL